MSGYRKRSLIFLLLILTVAPILSACTSVAQANSGKLSVVTTTSMIADVARNIAGSRADVIALMGAGVDPHLYKASARDVNRLADADIIFYNGLHLEAAMSKILERVGEQRNIIAVTDSIDRSLLFTPPAFKGNYDPHVWFDVTLWIKAAETMRDALIEYDPQGEAEYRANAGAYIAQMEELHQYALEQTQRVPKEKRVLVTAHDAFSYFGRAYDFEVVGLQGISTATEASTANVHDLAEMIASRRIPAVFIESSVPQRNIEAVRAAVQSRGFDVQIGGQLFSDAPGSPNTPEGTYIGMVRYNIDTIVNALLQER